MKRHLYPITLCLILCGLSMLPAAHGAQEFGSSALYSSGVEAYFRGCSAEAESAFSTLMAVDPLDPRAFYFRALTLARQGRCDEARADMEIGAELEANSPHRFDIGKTLERVQGPTRLMLEGYRRRAQRLAAMVPAVGAQRTVDTPVLREQRVVPLDEYARPGVPQSVVAPRPAQEVVRPALPAATPVPPAARPSVVDPFGDDAATAPPAQATPKAPPMKAVPPQAAPAQPLPPAPQSEAAEPKPSLKAEEDENPF